MKKITLAIFWISAVVGCVKATAQVGIDTTTPQAALDVASTSYGFLPPRVSLQSASDTATVTNPQGGAIVIGTIVYNTGAGSLSTPGYYFWNGSVWANLASASVSGLEWTTSGNAGNPGKVIGTTDANDFVVVAGGPERMRVSSAGNVGIGTNSPKALIHMENGHMRSTQTTLPTITSSSPAGAFFPNGASPNGLNTPIASPTDVRGTIALPGSGTNATSTATVTFATPYNFRPTVIVSLAGDSASNIDGNGKTYILYVVASTTGFNVNLVTSANTIGSFFNINYMVME